ncbi:MAG: DUF3488 and transglutaminase-like domain-containing protein [Acidimicrobiia bacterium]
MERPRIITIALIALSAISVLRAQHLISISIVQIFVLIFVCAATHLMSSLLSKNSKLASISPVISFLFITIVMLITNSRGNLSNAIPTFDSLLSLLEDSRSGIKAIRSTSSPFAYSTNIMLVAIIATWSVCEIGETLGQRLHSGNPTIFWYILINAGLAAQNGAKYTFYYSVIFSIGVIFYLYAFNRGTELSHAHLIGIDKSIKTTNFVQYSSIALAVVILSILVLSPVSTLPSYAPDNLFKSLTNAGTKAELSPLVSMSQQLKSEKTNVLFRATSNEVQYWRVRVLDDFDGKTWRTLQDVKSEPDKPLAGITPRTLKANIELVNLDNSYLPNLYSVQDVSETNIDFLRDGVLLNKNKSLKNYTVLSLANPSTLTPEQIEKSSEEPPSETDRSAYLPRDFDKSIQDLARGIASTESTLYDQVMSLKNYLNDGSFKYDLNVNYSSSTDAMKQFLKEKRGFCEQFATTYAAMVRSIGVPARVVVGFTPGEQNSNGVFTVTNTNAHSWVEVYLSNFGWLTVDPTPVGPAPGQTPNNIGQVVVTTTTTTVATVPVSSSATSTTISPNTKPNSTKSKSNTESILIFVLFAIALGAGTFFIRKRKVNSNSDVIFVEQTFKDLSEKILEYEPRPDLTIAELEKRVNNDNKVILEFLELLTLACYSPNSDISLKELKDAATKARTIKIKN